MKRVLFHLFVFTLVVLVTSLAMACSSDNPKDETPLEEGSYVYHFAPVDTEFDSIASDIASKEFYLERTPQTLENAKRLLEIASERGDSVLMGRALFWNVRVNQTHLPPDSCIEVLSRARRLISQSNDGSDFDYDLACIDYQLAGNNERIGNYLTTYQKVDKALPIFEKNSDHYFLGNAYLLMGLTYMEISEKRLAEEQINLAQKHYSLCNYPLNRIYYFKAFLAEPDSIDEKLTYFERSIVEGEKDPLMTIQAIIEKSAIYLGNNQIEAAAQTLSRADSVYQVALYTNPLVDYLLTTNHAGLAMAQKEYAKSLELYKKAEHLASQYPGEQWEANIYKNLAQIYEQTTQRDKAYEYLKKYQKAFEKQTSELVEGNIPKNISREQIARQKEQIRQQEETIRSHRAYIIAATIGIILILVIMVVLGMVIWQRIRIRKIENRELRNGLEQQMIIARFNRENFDNDIQKKECEISSSVLLLANKNDVLRQISEISQKYSDEGKIPREYVNQINNVVNESLKNDNEWDRFKVHFDSVHPAFFTKLQEKYPDLTENDLRLCAYIRIGMRAKEIAAMLQISPASVNSNRYRLRKKLGLAKEDNLDQIIRSI